jgi:hypothetical protein
MCCRAPETTRHVAVLRTNMRNQKSERLARKSELGSEIIKKEYYRRNLRYGSDDEPSLQGDAWVVEEEFVRASWQIMTWFKTSC